MPSAQSAVQLLKGYLVDWHQDLQRWSESGRLLAAAQEALMLEDTSRRLRDLIDQWGSGDFSSIPEIVLLSAADMNGAMGAYAISTGKIYLNKDWLLTAGSDAVGAVLTEELGHHLDGFVNEVDTPGDEGALLQEQLMNNGRRRHSNSEPRSEVDAGVVTIQQGDFVVENASLPVLRGSSLYLLVDGPNWAQAQASALSIGGNLVTINDSAELGFLGDAFSYVASLGTNGFTTEGKYFDARGEVWIGLYKTAQGIWEWIDGSTATYRNWTPSEPGGFPTDTRAHMAYDDSLLWDPTFVEDIMYAGLAEVATASSITFSTNTKEGAGLFTTSINLSAGTQASGNLAEGAQVWWKVTGITADDLVSGALSGNGIITNGKLDIHHSLKVDGDLGENFEISVFSDASMTQLIGVTSSVAVQEASPVIRGNSLYTLTAAGTWTNTQSQAVALGGNLVTINSSPENTFLVTEFYSPPGTFAVWIGYYQAGSNAGYQWVSGESSTYTNWAPGLPDFPSWEFYAHIDLYPVGSGIYGSGTWADSDNNGNGNQGLSAGIAEIPLTLSITRLGEVKEGSGVFTTSINLSAGSQASGNLAEGAQVWWKITGITADDLASGALNGNGIITNGKLDLQHSLKVDPDSGEYFEVSVFSDASMTSEYQIGTRSSVVIIDGNNSPTDLIFTTSGVPENSAAGTVIGALSATDPDPGSSFTYALVQGDGSNDADNSRVAIVGNEVRVAQNAVIDFETNPLLNLNIKVTDNGIPALSFTKALTVNVLDVAEEVTPPTVTGIAVQGTTVILTFSEAVTALSVPATAFLVQTVSSNNTATNRTITNVALDQNDATKVILNLSGTAPASNVNLRVSYTAPATNQTTGVVQDLAGNDLASFPNRFADTFITAATTTLASQYRNLTLTGTSAVNGTGNALNNRIIGNTNVNVLTGAAGTDAMDGGANGDRYVIVSALDR